MYFFEVGVALSAFRYQQEKSASDGMMTYNPHHPDIFTSKAIPATFGECKEGSISKAASVNTI